MERSRRGSVKGQTPVSTGIAALDKLLPRRGLFLGTLVEWLASCEGSGAATLALMASSHILKAGGAFVVVDSHHEYYPPLAAGLGIDLDRTIVVRPRQMDDALWAFEQSLRCPGVAISLCWFELLNDRILRRFQLAAEEGSGLGLLIRPETARREPPWTEVRLLVQPLPSRPGKVLVPNAPSDQRRSKRDLFCRRLRIEMLHCRQGMSGGAIELEIEDETGVVSLVPPMASATDLCRSAGA